MVHQGAIHQHMLCCLLSLDTDVIELARSGHTGEILVKLFFLQP